MCPEQQTAVPALQQVPWSGEVGRERIIDLFAQLFRDRKTGVLKLSRGKINKELFFRRGWLLFGRSNIANECLGRLLLEGGKITKEAFDDSIAKMKVEKRKQGDVLIDMGAVSPDDVYFGLKFQLRQRAIDILRWEDGQYHFVEGGELDPTISDILRVAIPSVIAEGIKEIYNPEQVRERLDPYLSDYLAKVEDSPFRPRDLGFSSNETDIYELINGYRTLREVYTLSKLVLRLTYLVVFTMLRLGMIEFRVMEEAVLEKQDRERISELYRTIKDQNFLEILRLDENASPGEIEDAYHRVCQELKAPEGLSRVDPKVQNLRAQIKRSYDQAFEVLIDDTKRRQYLQRLEEEKRRASQDEADRAVMSADLEFQRGETFLFWKQDYKEAVEVLTSAVRLNPKDPEYLATLALAVYMKDRTKLGNAREMINKALSMNPRCDKAYLYMGRMMLFENNKAEAARFFQKAVEINPANRKLIKEPT